jgi:hypothetical protein
MTINGTGTPVPNTVPFTFVLGPDWNMIANPFAASLPFSNLSPATIGGVTPYAFTYDPTTGSYLFISSMPGANVARTYFLPWEGAWIRSTVGVTSMTAGVPTGAAASAPQALDVGAGYLIPVVARAGKVADMCSAAGLSTKSAFTVDNPPRMPNSVDLYFVDAQGNELAQQVKAASAAGGTQTWNFVVTTDLPNTNVAVSLPDLSQVPNSLVVTLVDQDTGQSVYARTMPQYVFESGAQGAVRHFSLQVWPRGASDLVITAASAASMDAGVVVSYSVSSTCAVSVDVLNLAGRVVRHIVDGQPVASGVNTQVWNLRNDQGAQAPAGMYLVRIEALADNGERVQAVTQVSVNR